jgi:hypothetical protein
MKFEHLIWIVIFLIYVVSVILKKVRTASKTGNQGVAKKLPGWREKLNKLKAQIQQQAAGQEDSFEDLEPGKEEVPFDNIEQVIEKPPLPKMKQSVPKRKPSVMKADAKRLKPAVSVKKSRPKDLGFGIQELRKAVIWSEILAPPLALRDK